MSSQNKKTVLFLCVSEAGHSNSILALALELLTHPNTDVHLASFPTLRKRAEQLSSSPKVVQNKHPSSTFTFHDIGGASLGEAFVSKATAGFSITHPPMAKSHDNGMSNLMLVIAAWNGKGTVRRFRMSTQTHGIGERPFVEYVRVVESCKEIIKTVDPSITVVDSALGAACEACWSLNKRYITNCPMSTLDVVRENQPIWKQLFYYPL